jgi:SnoaL-like domain
MSQENVELVRRAFEEDEEGLFDRGWERILDFWEPRGDYYPVENFPESRPCHGAKEIACFFSEFQQAWGRYEVRIEAITPVGDDRVLVHSRLAAEGRESGLHLQLELFHCFWLRHVRVFRQEDHLTLPGALQALGLSGETLEAAGLRE